MPHSKKHPLCFLKRKQKCLQIYLLFSLLFAGKTIAQSIDSILTIKETERIEKILSADSMEGRSVTNAGIEKAAHFISNEFNAIGLQVFNNADSYFEAFTRQKANDSLRLTNVVGLLPGNSKPDEYVIFSAHYDHLGIGNPVNGDSIYNGANDDAAGVTAVIMLAEYFKALHNNERTLIFVAFTAEEVGGFGSRYFSSQLDPVKVAAMFNIEMIGTDSKWGNNSAYITGYEKTDLGKILQKNLEGTQFKFYPDPYTDQHLFYRSDNATLARLGVPAHTISTSKMDNEPNYHKPSDEIGTLDLKNMTEIIKAIALSSKSIVNGTDTPSRVNTDELK